MGLPPFHWHYADLDDTTTSAYQLRDRTLFFLVILFAILLLASLLLFYARWVCHSPPSSNNLRDAVAQVGRRRGLEDVVISSLPVIVYGSMRMMISSSSHEKFHDERPEPESECEEAGGECCICLSLFDEGDKIKVLPHCNHCFQSDCVDSWLLTHITGPLCHSCLTFHRSSAAAAPETHIVIH